MLRGRRPRVEFKLLPMGRETGRDRRNDSPFFVEWDVVILPLKSCTLAYLTIKYIRPDSGVSVSEKSVTSATFYRADPLAGTETSRVGRATRTRSTGRSRRSTPAGSPTARR